MLESLTCPSKLNYIVKEHTTLKIGGEAEIAFFPTNRDELVEAINYLKTNNKNITLIGLGSNLLVSSTGIEGGVIITSGMKTVEFLDDFTIKADAGVKSVIVAKRLLEKSLTGLEFLIGIPGSIGGAVYMNSGAHKQEINHCIKEVEVFDFDTNEIKTLSKEECGLSYRTSVFQSNNQIILNVTFELKSGESAAIKERMDFNLNYRAQNHPPVKECNAGSTFRNPEAGVAVGRLLEELGAKTWEIGDMRISQKHANFITNIGEATSIDASRMMFKMASEVKSKYGYDISPEIKFIGRRTEEEEKIWQTFQKH